MPCFMPLLQSPSYSAPDRKQYLPYPWIQSSAKMPEYLSPLSQQQVPQPFFLWFSTSPSQQSPLLQVIFVLPSAKIYREIYVSPYSSLLVVPSSITSYSPQSGLGLSYKYFYWFFFEQASVTRKLRPFSFSSFSVWPMGSYLFCFMGAYTFSSPSFLKYSSANY